MTRDDIIRMARKAAETTGTLTPSEWNEPLLERFAAFVAAAEREKVARWQIGSGYTTGHGETIEDLLVELEWQVRESEREECAKVCENLANQVLNQNFVAEENRRLCAKVIRARGQE